MAIRPSHPKLLARGTKEGSLALQPAAGGAIQDAQDAVLALVATGMAPWDAMLALLQAGTPTDRFPVLAGVPAHLRRAFLSPEQAVKTCATSGRRDPSGANAVLNAYLAGRTVAGGLILDGCGWLKSLPSGLAVGGDLGLRGTRLTALPRDLRVGGYLDLAGSAIVGFPDGFLLPRDCFCLGTPLTGVPEGFRVGGTLDLQDTCMTALPAGLWVGGTLWLNDCLLWDGRIPEDAHVGVRVGTDLHPGGIPLADWRAIHPSGERSVRF
jgi:hypothetical protein